ncbi:MAG: hypothetical protein HGA54_02315 [Actinobacteria bacterium]|nr:hypothetical protein [Actinomycetota bacterium]
MNVTVKFALTPSVNEKTAHILELPTAATLGDLKVLMIEQSPELDRTFQTHTCLINHVAGKDDSILNDGDEIILWQLAHHG